ncbi:MAG: HD-GYP domain-containing protein [Gaiellales bacterium]
MLRPRDPDRDAEDPTVRRTVARLRASLLAVALGSVGFLLLGVLATRIAWIAGIEQGRAAGAAAALLPTPSLLVAVIGCFVLLGIVLVLVVRAPFDQARTLAVDLLMANERLDALTLETFAALGAAVEARDRYTMGHGLRVTLVSILIGQELELSQHELDILRRAATFHDIGKIAIPDDVMHNPGRLTDGQFEVFKSHSAEGARICSKLESLRPCADLVRSHHERMDGRGYPDGLRGEQIPLGARIIAVADAWDAITSDRPYRAGQPAFVALEEIRRCAGTQFDDRVVRAFVEVLAKDPWMFGLNPIDVADRRPLPAPTPASRGVDESRYAPSADRDTELASAEQNPDWSRGFGDEDLRSA